MLWKSLVAAGALALAATSANAGVSFYSFGSGAPSLPLVTDFSGDTVGGQPTTAAAGFSWAAGGTATVLDTTSGAGAEPAIANGVYGTGNYLSTEANTTETLDISKAGIKDISLYVGSLDAYNSVTFGGVNVTYTGGQLGAISGADNGAQTTADTNGVFHFTFGAPVTSITFNSSQNSFEVASISAGVPEPASWALMIGGFGLMGAAVRSRRAAVAA